LLVAMVNERRPSSVPPPRWRPGQADHHGGNPQLPPKPPGKTLMYVYEHPDGTTTYHTVNQDGPSEHVDHGYGVNGAQPGSPDRAAAPQGRGYNLLADMGDVRPSSRAGRLFAKQQERMPRYTSESQAPPQAPPRTAPPTPLPRRCMTSLAGGAAGGDGMTSRSNLPAWLNGAGKKSNGVKWGVPQHLQNGGNTYGDDVMDYRGSALAPLPQPLPEWRAKTEANYKYGDPPIRPFSAVGFGNTHSGGWGDSPYYPFTVGSKIGIPIGTVSFDARLYQVNPHRKQVAQDAYTPELFLMRDFNARPVGWTRDFVVQYHHGRV